MPNFKGEAGLWGQITFFLKTTDNYLIKNPCDTVPLPEPF